MRKENRAKITFHHVARKIYILGHTDAVMITADVLTAQSFWDTPTLRSYSVGAPTL